MQQPLSECSQGLADDLPSPSSSAETNELTQALEHGLHALPARTRAVLKMRFLAGMTYEQIAEQLGAHTSTAFNQIQRSVQRLRQTVDATHDDLPESPMAALSPTAPSPREEPQLQR